MSWVISRRKGDIFQMYRREDIYGRGVWLANEDCNFWDFPVMYKYKVWAENRMQREKETDPEWEYSVDFYDR